MFYNVDGSEQEKKVKFPNKNEKQVQENIQIWVRI